MMKFKNFNQTLHHPHVCNDVAIQEESRKFFATSIEQREFKIATL